MSSLGRPKQKVSNGTLERDPRNSSKDGLQLRPPVGQSEA